MAHIRTVLVDDEAPARHELRRFLQGEKDFEIVGEAGDGEEAVRVIKNVRPAVVFLDIHMPKRDGLEVAKDLSQTEHPPLIVFVTAYDQYAIKAFEMNAIDYVLKPFEETRFKKTCDKIRSLLSKPDETRKAVESLGQFLEKGKPLKILGHTRGSKERIFIHEESVLFFHVELTEVMAHLNNGEELFVNANLKALLDMLDPKRFQQCHRAYIVNLDQVEKVIPLFAGNFKLSLKDSKKSEIPLSRRYAKKLKQYLNW